jgi:co-chaperonin GroES (HSP10)
VGFLFPFPVKRGLSASAWLLLAVAGLINVQAQTQTAQDPSIQRSVGAIKAITDDGITLASDSGEEIKVTLQDSARILRVAPGEKDLKNATPVQKQDLQVGDRILVRGKPGPDGHSVSAAAVIVMKQADVASKRQQEKEDWQKRGVGGLVTAVDASGTITISVMSFSGTKTVAIHTRKDTVLRRYAPNSVKFDDARVAPLDQIRVGDQLRARGTKNSDGTELDAQEVVSGTFRNLAGQITAIDSAANTLTLKDAISKQTVVVRVTGDAQLRKVPPEFAQRIAMRLKSGMAGGIPGAGEAVGGGERTRGQGGRQFPGGGGGGMGGRGGGPPDFQQMLNRMPPASLTDLEKGDVVMIVSTEGDGSGAVNAITLLAGVEPILTAAPNASQAMMLSPWTLSSGNAEAAANQ